MVFVQKRRISFFSHLFVYIKERSKNWPDIVTAIEIPRHIFYRYRYGYQSLKVSTWSVIRYSYDEHSNFFLGEVTWRDLVTWPSVIWVWNFHKVCGKGVCTGVPKTKYLQKTSRGCSNTPCPAPVKEKNLKHNFSIAAPSDSVSPIQPHLTQSAPSDSVTNLKQSNFRYISSL